MIALIWAEDQNGLIGAAGQLPWHLPADMHRFKTLTTGHIVVMGRTTFDGFKRPLPRRENWVLSRQNAALPTGVFQLHDLAELQALDAQHPDDELFVIGGAKVFEAVLPLATRLYQTVIHHAFTGDTWMPPIDYSLWQLVTQEVGTVDDKNPYPFEFNNYHRQ